MTVVTGKKRRLTIIECPNDMNAMCDVAKVADLALLLVDGAYGFQMETFEFLNMYVEATHAARHCRAHGSTRASAWHGTAARQLHIDPRAQHGAVISSSSFSTHSAHADSSSHHLLPPTPTLTTHYRCQTHGFPRVIGVLTHQTASTTSRHYGA